MNANFRTNVKSFDEVRQALERLRAVLTAQQQAQLIQICMNEGEQGEMGMPGIQGIQGPQGVQGIPGIMGEDGENGMDGVPGGTGPQGSAGAMGPPGLDAEIDAPYLPTNAPLNPPGVSTKYLDGTFQWSTPAGGTVIPGVCNGRLTLTTVTPVTTADVTAATQVYFTPYLGYTVACYGGVAWQNQTFTEVSIKTTDAQTGTTHNGTKVIDGLMDTSGLVRGMAVTGTNVGASAVIVSIDSATQVTVDVNSTGSASNTMTFKCPASKQYDVFAVISSSTIALRFSNAWSSATARADALALLNGVNVNNAAINSGDSNSIAANQGLYLGSISTTATAGQTEDSTTNRLIFNAYNSKPRSLKATDGTNSWTYSTAGFQERNASSTLGTSRVAVMIGLSEDLVIANVYALGTTATTGADCGPGVGIDSSTVDSSITRGMQFNAPAFGTGNAKYAGYPGIGYHTIRGLETGQGSGTQTWYGDDGSARIQSGLTAEVIA